MTEVLPEFTAWGQMADFAEKMWFDKKRLPTEREYFDCLITYGWTTERIRRLIRHDYYQKMLHERGLYQAESEGDLMPEQLAAINTYLNVADQRSLRLKLIDLGITVRQFNGWLKYPPFKAYLEKQAQDLFAEGLPMAHRALMGQVAAGNVRAIKLYYDKLGYGADTAQGNIGDVKVIMMRLIEVIQRHVTDQDTMKAIARDFDAVINGSPVPAIRGEITRDGE